MAIKITKGNYKGKVRDFVFNGTNYYYANTDGKYEYLKVHNCDIDWDSEDGGRDKVLEYLIHKYGQDSVCNVVTIGKFKVKSALTDMSRGLGKPTGMNTTLSRKILKLPEFEDTNDFNQSLIPFFDKMLGTTTDNDIIEWIRNNDDTIELADKLIGQMKSLGTHAGGIVVTPKPIYNYIPVTRGKSNLVTAFSEADGSSKDLSELGLIKLDVLGLQTLNVLKNCMIALKKDKNLELFEYINFLPLNDEKMIAEFAKGDNYGIFQMEKSKQFIDAFVKSGSKIDSFDDIIAINAMNRPGPKEKYINKYGHWKAIDKGAKKISKEEAIEIDKERYPFPFMREVLSETFGTCIYQEQIMSLVCELTGMSFGESDVFRRSIAWNKEHPKYYTVKSLFDNVETSMLKRGYTKEDVDFFLKYLKDVSGYSFNKCLSANHLIHLKGKGKVRLLDVKIGDYILGKNTNDNCNEWVKVKDIHINGKKQVYKCITESGKILECTLDHKLVCEDGVKRKMEEVVNGNYKVITKSDYDYKFECIVSCKSIGLIDTYDLEVDSEFHNYYANNICVSNSHSVAYGYIAWQCLYFKTYYPAYFYCACLNQESKEEKIKIIISVAKNSGIQIKPISINKSEFLSTVENDNSIRFGYKLLKGMGDAARAELNTLELNSCKTIYDVLEKPFKKINSTVLKNLVELGCFDELEENREKVKKLFLLYKDAKIEKWFTRKTSTLALKTMPPILSEEFNSEEVMQLASDVAGQEKPHLSLIKLLSVHYDSIEVNKLEIEQQTLDKEKELLGFQLTVNSKFVDFSKRLSDDGFRPMTLIMEEDEESDVYKNCYFEIINCTVAYTKTKKPYLNFMLNDGIKEYKANMWINSSKENNLIPSYQKARFGIGNFTRSQYGFNLTNLEIPKI